MMDAQGITRALGGKWYGRYGQARCPAHGDRNPSLSLSDGRNGRLLAKCHAGCDFATILDSLRDLGLVPGDGSLPVRPAGGLRRNQAEEEAQAAKRERQAVALWKVAQPIGGTVAETYLRGRAINCPLPGSLRFAPDCWHPTAKRFPAMVALVEGSDRFAVHRTYLRPDGSGKADADPAKAMLGRTLGGAVRLSDEGGPLVVAEGIETGLSLLSGLLSGPASVWAALSTSGFSGLQLPAAPGRLVIASDGDRPGRAAADSLARRADALGWDVSLLPAPKDRDWNDVLTGKGTGA